MGWAGHMARFGGEETCIQSIGGGKFRERYHLQLYLCGRIQVGSPQLSQRTQSTSC